MVATIIVLQFPPRESRKTDVIMLGSKERCFGLGTIQVREEKVFSHGVEKMEGSGSKGV
jgi:hypothetical protein